MECSVEDILATPRQTVGEIMVRANVFFNTGTLKWFDTAKTVADSISTPHVLADTPSVVFSTYV